MKTQRILLLATILIGGVALTATAATQYHLTDLGALTSDVNQSRAFGINNNGVVVGDSVFFDSTHGVDENGSFIWTSGTGIQKIGGFGPLIDSSAQRINDAGEVVGLMGTMPNPYAWTSSGGVQAMIPRPGQNIISGINSSGQIVGASGASTSTDYALFWNSATDSYQELGFLSGSFSKPGAQATGINDDGVVVGWSVAQATPIRVHAFRWTSAGGLQDIGADPGLTGGSQAFDINNNGQTVGTRNNRAVLWGSDLSIQDLGTPLNADRSEATLINNNGLVVGFYVLNSQSHLFTWNSVDGLNDLLLDGSGTGWSLGLTDMNDSGEIVGYGTNPDGFTHGFILTPVPEPSSITLALAGVGIGALRWRRIKNWRG